ncbi:MAG: ParB-like nuclease domain-containing protein, partial [Chloroflexi bacterium]|nr:ParB-like nuclease domain-containing protein [Chloroflexota bacterium]
MNANSDFSAAECGEVDIRAICIDEIEATATTQVRHRLDARVIEEYADAMQAGAIFPALMVFAEKDSQRYILADGFHRLEAAKASGLAHFSCEVQLGGVRAALGHALGANDQHGLRRTNADKRNAVELALKDPEWAQWSHASIARLCRVADKTVAKIREDMVLSGDIEPLETTKYNKAGKEISRKSNSSTVPYLRNSNSSVSREVPNQKSQTDTDLQKIKASMVKAEDYMRKASLQIGNITAIMED